jgi:hypothetical protein
MESGIQETIAVGDRPFVFSLFRKMEDMGPVSVDHWWMRTTELYRQRAQRRGQSGNFDAITEAFWALCREGGTEGEPDVQESYLLSKLVPYVRSQGSRRVFADAYLEPGRRAHQRARQEAVAELEALVCGSRQNRLSRVQFHSQTAEVLGPPRLSEEVIGVYQHLCAEFLGSARQALAADESHGVQTAIAGWQGVMRSVGRRRGQAVLKQVLDILSYEARAALHRCYSAVWAMRLLPQLGARYGLSPESVAFLKLWHLDHVEESNQGDRAYFHLFHGHVFALHPASGELLRTATGQELVGECLQSPTRATWERLLHGLLVAVMHYDLRRQQVSSDRRKQPVASGGTELVDLEHQLVQRRSGRRRRRHRPDVD